MSNQGTIRLKVINGSPSIEKLWNGRFKLEFLCDNNSPKEDWYYGNISSILPDYGILQDTNFGSGVSEDWEAIPDSVYPDMRLVETEYLYISSIGDKRVKLTYETLTASWAEEKDEDTDYELNGLKRVSRTFVALPATTYDKIVGTSTIESNGTTLYLGSFKIEETDAKWSLSEVWLEPGILSLSEDYTDPNGTETGTAFNMTDAEIKASLGLTGYGYLLTKSTISNYNGIQTTSFTYKQNRSSDVIDYDLNGLMRLTTVSRGSANPLYGQEIGVSSITLPVSQGGKTLYLANLKIVDSEIKEETYVWIEPGIIDETQKLIDGGLRQVSRVSFKDENVPLTGVVVSKKQQNYNGYPVWATTTIQLRDGTDPTSAVASEHSIFVPFTYPGVANATEDLIASGSFFYSSYTSTAYDIQLIPPVTADIEATVTISYQTSNQIGILPFSRWSPKEWASVESSWSWVLDSSLVNQGSPSIGGKSRIGSKYKGLPGYRVGVASVSYVGENNGGVEELATFFGQTVGLQTGGNWDASGSINIIGGPENPENNSYVIKNPVLEEAFSDIDGTQYYRKVIITATIPPQI